MKIFQLLTIALLCIVFVASAGRNRRSRHHKHHDRGDGYDMATTDIDSAETTLDFDNTETTDDEFEPPYSSTWNTGDKSHDHKGRKGKKDCWGKRKRRRKKGNGRGRGRGRGKKDCDDSKEYWLISSTWDSMWDTWDTTDNDDDMTSTTDSYDDITSTVEDEECPPPTQLNPLTSPCECWSDELAPNCPVFNYRCALVDGVCTDGNTAGMRMADGDGIETGPFETRTSGGATVSIIGGVIAAIVIILCLIIGLVICAKKGNKYDNIAATEEADCNGDTCSVSEGIEFGRAMPMETGGNLNGETGKTHTIIKYESDGDDKNSLIDGNYTQ